MDTASPKAGKQEARKVISLALTREQVRQLARLARLDVSEQEEPVIAAQLSSILGHAENLSRVDTTGVPPTYHTVSVERVREDRPHESLDQGKVLEQAPQAESGYFKVPKITEG